MQTLNACLGGHHLWAIGVVAGCLSCRSGVEDVYVVEVSSSCVDAGDASCRETEFCAASKTCIARLADGSQGCERDRMCASNNCVGDACCPTECPACSGLTCLYTCGNSETDPGEACDQGSANGVLCEPPVDGTCPYCSANCQWAEVAYIPAVCGLSDGICPTSCTSAQDVDCPVPFLRVNVGGPMYVGDNTWVADGAGSGVGFSTSVAESGAGPFPQNTADERVLLSTLRWWNIGIGQSAQATVSGLTNGTYAVRFLVNEDVWSTVGARVFGFEAEGQRLDSSIDPYALGGSQQNVGVWRSYTGIIVSDGALNLAWPAIADNPEIRALEIAGPGFATCQTQCAGIECGDDGCDGSCGICGVGTCNEATGLCVGGPSGPVFPRLAVTLIGGLGLSDYTTAFNQQVARFDLALVEFWKGWGGGTSAMRSTIQSIKSYNPNILLGNYTINMEVYTDLSVEAELRAKIDANNWWAWTAAGAHAVFYPSTWSVNITSYTAPDTNGQRWSQWYADWSNTSFFEPIPELDFWYCDNVWREPSMAADWNVDGSDESQNIAAAWYRAGTRAHFDRIHGIQPTLFIMGNSNNDLSDPEYQGQLEAAFFEAPMGEGWSIELDGWDAMMARYRALMANTKSPHIVIFNPHGTLTDYQFFRYAFGSCLLDDGYLSFTDIDSGFSTTPWFDEYDHALGAATDSPPMAAWQNGVWRRGFQNGIVLLNPTSSSVDVTVEAGFHRLSGTQDSSTNNGQAVTGPFSLGSKDGLVLLRN